MNDLLFRKEVIETRAGRWAGSILLVQPVPVRLATALSAILAVSLAVFLCVGEYTRKARVTGQLTPASGSLKVLAPQFGRVTARPVHEGMEVKAGQVLYELSAERASDGTDIDERIHNALSARGKLLEDERAVQSQSLQERGRFLATRQQSIVAEQATLEREITLQRQRIENARSQLERYQNLRTSGFATLIQLQQAENDHTDQQARLVTLERERLAAQRELLQTQEEARQITGQIRLNDHQSDRAVALLEQEAAEHQSRSRVQVLAPADGLVSALGVEPGNAVQAGQALATVIPMHSPFEAHLWAPSKAVGFIEPGQRVSLRLSAFPYQKFGQLRGEVVRVDLSPGDSGSSAMDGAAARDSPGEPRYLVVVRLRTQYIQAYGKQQALKSGMTLEADVLQDHRRLIEWAIDPLLSAATGRGS